jgi:hypothetical protein
MIPLRLIKPKPSDLPGTDGIITGLYRFGHYLRAVDLISNGRRLMMSIDPWADVGGPGAPA